MCPYSDLDCAVLLADATYRGGDVQSPEAGAGGDGRYFRSLLSVLQFSLELLGEADNGVPVANPEMAGEHCNGLCLDDATYLIPSKQGAFDIVREGLQCLI